MDEARRTLAEATAFVKQKDLLTLADNSNLAVIDTPVFMRGVYGVGGFNAAPGARAGAGRVLLGHAHSCGLAARAWNQNFASTTATGCSS